MKAVGLTLIFMLFAPLALCSETNIRITNGEWQPYLSEHAYQYGLASHIVAEAFKLEGISVTWGFFNWKRAYENARMGEDWDASAVWWPTEEARKDFLISAPVVETSNVLFYRKDKPFDWQSMSDLQGVQVGFTRGYNYGEEFMAELDKEALSIQTVATDEQNFHKLLLGRIDVFPNDPVVGYAQLRTIFSEDKVSLFRHHPKAFGARTLNLIISKKSQHGEMFLKKFNSGMKKLRASGRLEQMFKALVTGQYDKKAKNE